MENGIRRWIGQEGDGGGRTCDGVGEERMGMGWLGKGTGREGDEQLYKRLDLQSCTSVN